MTNKTSMPEPDAYIFQHEETGQIHEIDAQQVEWGFEKNNPRLKLIGSLYSSEKMEAYAEARVREALEEAAKVAMNAPITSDMLDSDSAKAVAFHTSARIRALIKKENKP